MSYDPADNPLFNLLDTDSAADKAKAGVQRHSTIMTGIQARGDQSASELSGRYYYNPKTAGYENITDDAYAEAVDADRNLGVQDMPVGLSGMKNRKRFLDISQAMLGLHSPMAATVLLPTNCLQKSTSSATAGSRWAEALAVSSPSIWMVMVI